MNIEILLFYFFSSIAVLSGIMVIGARNPIHSVLFLILVFCNATGLIILLEAEFLAMIFLVVYVGAIAVLFLFIVMMLNVRLIEFNESILRYLPIGALIGLIFLLELYLVIGHELTSVSNFDLGNSLEIVTWASQVDSLTNMETIGELLYTHYFYLFLVASLVLLVAMIGAIVLTLHHRENVKRQEIFSQVARDFEQAIKLKS